MIALAVAWPALIAAVETDRDEVAGWIVPAVPPVRRASVTPAGAWDDAALVALAGGPTPLALFHSHPEGRAALSDVDRAAWAPRGLPLWPWPMAVIATRHGRAVSAAVFVWPAGTAAPRAIARLGRDRDGRWSAR